MRVYARKEKIYSLEKMMKSKFTGNTFGLIGMYIVVLDLTTITMGIGAPWAVCMFMRWTVKHTIIDGQQLRFDGKGGRYFGKLLLWSIPGMLIGGLTVYTMFYVQDIATATLLTVAISVLMLFYVFWLMIRELKWFTKNTHFVNGVEDNDELL